MTGTKDSDYGDGSKDIAGTNYDWGVYNYVMGVKTWRTMTRSEWYYLLNQRERASDKRGHAKLRISDNPLKYVSGYVFLPDNYYEPDVTFHINTTGYNNNIISLEDWKKMEAAGAAFLPAAGYRLSTMQKVDEEGRYWTASADGDSFAYSFDITENSLDPIHFSSTQRHCGISVRLVQDVK
ncbi:MAG: hypothetical protein IJ776_09870 [Paludibacteraceae bacterium]|nr:hypothetical protein [Paludibacteraceae bacterium]